MEFHHFANPQQARAALEAVIAQRRSQQFVADGQPEDDADQSGIRADYLLHSLHATLSAQRTLWSTFELLRRAVRIEVDHELSDSALSYIGQLAASGLVDLVTHEHVAELLAIKDPSPAQGEPGQEAAQ